jgi:cyclophilin family peptidyl-prolyl cis-trans isomerase
MRRLARRAWRILAWPLVYGLSVVCVLGSAPSAEVLPDGLYAVITTPRGEITAELFARKAPLAVMNFVGLAEGIFPANSDKPFFDGLTFHRVIPGFVVQGGAPGGRGDGGPGYHFPDEFVPGLSHDAAGILSMANTGPDTNSSQFFFTLAPVERLDYLHSVFGRAVRGGDVLAEIKSDDTMKVRILRVGREAQGYRADPQVFSDLSRDAAFNAYMAERYMPAVFFDDRDHLLPEAPPRAKAFNHKLSAFARVTGRKLFVQLLAEMPRVPEAGHLDGYVRELAQSIGAEENGVLAVYVAACDEWKLWISDDLQTVLRQREGAVPESMHDRALQEKQEQLLTSARKRLSVPDGPADSPPQRLKLACDDLLASLIAAFEPKPPAGGRE